MTTSEERTPPGGDAWRTAQAEVSDRNEQAKKAGRAEKAAHEKKLAALKRAAEGKRQTFH
jgi:anti-sigma28 factor (negative regulator of flagellin synthesis)